MRHHLVRRRLGFALAAVSAAVVMTVGPSSAAVIEPKLVGGDLTAGDELGTSCGIDGDVLVLGAPLHDQHGSDSGAAYVFERSAGAWSEAKELVAGDNSAGDGFGHSCAVSGDTVVVGVPFDDDDGSASGSAYVYVQDGGAWSFQQKLRAGDDDADAEFGYAVDIEDDTIVVGSPGDDEDGADAGAVYVFTRSGTQWTQDTKLRPDFASAGSRLGSAVALSRDTVGAGAPRDGALGIDGGAVTFFRIIDGVWGQEGKVIGPPNKGPAMFGTAVGLSGEVAVIGAPFDGAGEAYACTRLASGWAIQAGLARTLAESDAQFGIAVAIEDGLLAVGANQETPSANRGGAIFTYVRNRVAYDAGGRMTPSDAVAGQLFGAGLEISGRDILVGAVGDASEGVGAGAAYVIEGPAAPPVLRSFLLPKKVSVKVAAGKKSKLSASGTLDTGPDDPDLTLPATLTVGSRKYDIPAFESQKGGKRFRYAEGPVSLLLTPGSKGRSKGKFKLTIKEDLAGDVAPDGNVEISIESDDMHARTEVDLDKGRFKLGKVPSTLIWPPLAPSKFKAKLEGTPNVFEDSYKIVANFAFPGGVPAAAPDLYVQFGNESPHEIASLDFVPKKGKHQYKADGPGVTKAQIDYKKARITLVVKKVDLGLYPVGSVFMTLTVRLDGEDSQVEYRAARKKNKITY